MSKNILVTGGCGFIASNFINYIHDNYKDCNIINLDKIDYCSNSQGINHTELVVGNITDRSLVRYLIDKYNFDVVFHFAAHSHVCNSFNDPVKFCKENALGTHSLLETFRTYKPDVEFIHFSTDEVYGENKTDVPFTEDSVLHPTNPYSASKAAAEMIVNSYIESFKMKIKIIRCNNVYGPRQYPEKLIPKFIKLLCEDKKCTIHGKNSSKTKRAFIHVDDVSRAVETLWLKGSHGEAYNISSNYELSVIDVTKIIIKEIKSTDDYEQWIEYVDDRLFNDERYYINDNKLRQLGWEPVKELDDLKSFIRESKNCSVGNTQLC